MDGSNVGIFIFDGVELLDFAGPYDVFASVRLDPSERSRRPGEEESAPFNVFTLARVASPVTTMGGLRVIPQHTLADAPRIDVLVVPGGYGTRALLDDEEILGWLRESAATAKLVTSVCTGSLLLAKAGLLDGRRATTHWSALDLLASMGRAITVEREVRVVVDGVITSAGVASGIDMAFTVVERLHGKVLADETARCIEYRR